mmetsp:Transcript_7402/g.16123  ORF Transcript_7402/g.16123 Transcript_7402/m.16123 type:complete len:484 (-) Transcript_7402:344-1795(-)
MAPASHGGLRGWPPQRLLRVESVLGVHAAHGGLLRRGLRDHCLGGGHQGGHRGGIHQGSADDLGRVNDSLLEHVHVLTVLRIISHILIRLLQQLVHHHGPLPPGVAHNGRQGLLQRPPNNVHTHLLVRVGHLEAIQALGGVQQGGAAPGDDTLLNRGLGGVEGVVKTVLGLADGNLAGAADLDHSHPSAHLRQTLLHLVLLILAGVHLDGLPDLVNALCNLRLAATSSQYDGVVLGDLKGLALTQGSHLHLFQLHARVLRHHFSTCQYGNVLQHGLAVVAEPGSLHRAHLQPAPELVQHQGRQRIPVDILRHDQQRPLQLGHVLQHGEDALHIGDLLVVHEHQRLGHLHHLGLGVGAKVGGDVPTVKAHALHDLQLMVQGLPLADGDGAVLAHALEGLGEHGSDLRVGVGGDGGNLLDLRLVLNRLGPVGQVLEHYLHSSIDPTLQVHGVHPRGDGLAPLHHDRATQHSGCGGTVSGDVVGLG